MRFSWMLLVVVAGCGRSEPPVYQACEVADDCGDLPESVDAACLPKNNEGFCSWTCDADAACNVPLAEGEERSRDDWNLVCASFESQPESYCFPACRDAEDAEADGGEVCPEGFTCRSTGGGSDNRQVCFPG